MMTSLLSSSELSLECKPPSQSHAMLAMKPLVDHNNTHSPDQATSQKLQEYLHRLEEERIKIDAFKRELPLCMHLLTHEMETSRQQLQSYNRENQGIKPVLEEFMPLKNSSNSEVSDQKPTNMSDKANWMTSAQLWSQSGDGNKQQSSTLPKTGTDIGFGNVNPKLGFDSKQRNGGAFLPFANDQNSGLSNSSIKALSVPDLALASSDLEMEDKKLGTESGNGINGSMTENLSKGGNGVTEKTVDTTTTQTHRKARRCWSPDLHRRFVNALQMLGGSQVATPKQIRELMKVDGLTNDEVKSHLQKYRLHTRRPGPSPSATGTPAPQLVVLGGIWVPPEYTTATAAVHGDAPTIYSTTHTTSQLSPHYCSPTVPHDFYPPLPPPSPLLPPPHAHAQLHPSTLHHHHHQVHFYKTSSHTQVHSSPESDARGVGDRSESIEDGKSENSSWKSGGDNDGDGKKWVALRDDGGESNGSEIILKF